MTIQEAKELLSFHACSNDDFNNPKWENGFLGSLRPYRNVLPEENFIEVMECLKVLAGAFSKDKIDHSVIRDAYAVVYLGERLQYDLDEQEVISEEHMDTLDQWMDLIQIAIYNLLEGDPGTAFFEYGEYLEERGL